MRFIMFALAILLSGSVGAKEIVKGEQAGKLFDQLELLQAKSPQDVTSYVNSYFGDSERPHLGRLWVTTIYLTHEPPYFCYKSDFRDVKVIEYLCEINR